MSARILHVDLDAFFVEVCRQRHPELRDVELLVVGGRRDQRGVVQSASYGARRFGIHAGMPIAQAVRLCPAGDLLPGLLPPLPRRLPARCARCCSASRPTVVMASLDEAYLDFAGTERLYPVSLLPVAEQIRDAVRASTGLDCSIGIGPNRMIAKLASDAAKPRGLMEVRAGWEEGFLAGLALSAMPGVGPKTAARWAELGLADVWQIQQMEEAALARLIGPEARALKRRAHGYGGTTLRARPAAHVGEPGDHPLARPARPRGSWRPFSSLLTARVAGQLRDEHLVGPHRHAQAAARRLPHGHPAPHASRWPPTSTPSSTAPRATCSGRRSTTCAARNRGVRLIGVAATNLRRRGGGRPVRAAASAGGCATSRPRWTRCGRSTASPPSRRAARSARSGGGSADSP